MAGALPAVKYQDVVAHDGPTNCVSIGARSGQLFVTGGDDRKVKLWRVGTRADLRTFIAHKQPVTSAIFDLAENSVLSGSASGQIYSQDIESGKITCAIASHKQAVTCMAQHFYMPSLIASGGADCKIRIWDRGTGKEAAAGGCAKGVTYVEDGWHRAPVTALRFMPDKFKLVSGAEDGRIAIWDLRAGKLLHAYEGPITHRGAVLSIDFDPTEPNTFATGGADGILRFWSSDLPFSCKGISASDSSAVRSVNFLPDGGAVLAGTNNHLRSWAIPHKMGAAAAPAPPTAGRAAGLPYASTLDMLDIPWASLQCCWLGQNIRRGSAAAGTGGKGALHLMGASIAGSVVSIWGADLTQMAPLADKPLHAFSVLAAGSGAGAASAAAGGSNSSGIAAAAVAGGKQSQPATVSIDLQAPTPQFAAGSGGAAAAGGSTAAGAGATAFAGGAAVQLQPAPAGRRSQAGSAAAGGASESKLDMQQSPLKLPVSTSSSSSSSAPATAPAPGVAAAPPAVDIEEEFMAMLSGQVDIFPHSSTAGKDASSSRKQQAAAVSRHSSGGKNTGAHLPSSSLPSSRAASSRSSGTVAPVEDTSLQEGEDSSSWGAGGEGSDPFAKRDKLLREKGAAASASTAAGAAAAVSASLTAVHSSAFAEEVPEEEEEQEDSEAGEDGEEEEEQGQGDTSILARTLASIDISAAASSSSAAAMGGAPPPHTADVRRGKGQSSERKIAEEEVDDEEALESHSYPSILGGSGPLSSAAQSFTAGSGKSQQEIAAALKAYGSRYGGVGGGAAASQDEGKAAETPTSGREAGSKGRSTASSSTSGHRAAGSQDSADSKSSYSEDEFVSEEEDVKGLEEEKQRRRQKQTGAQTQTQTPSTLASPAGKHAGASALFSPLSPVDGSPRAEPSSERAAAGLGTASPLSTSNGLRQFNLQLAKQAQQEQQQQQAMPGVSSSSTASTAAPTAASTATAAAHSSADGSSRTKSPERKAEHKPSASSKSSKAGASSSSGSGSGSGRKAALVPSQRDRPLGLDFNEFLPHSSSAGASGAAGGGARLGQGLGATGLLSLSKGGVAFSSSSPGGMSLRGTLRRQQQLELEEVRTAARLLQGHENFCSGLASRAEEEAAAGELWRRGQINDAISAIAASSAEDAVVAADFLRNHRLQSGVLGLEAAALLLPCCSYLLQSMQAEFAELAAAALLHFFQAFKAVVADTAAAVAAASKHKARDGHDFAAEERLRKCEAFVSGMETALESFSAGGLAAAGSKILSPASRASLEGLKREFSSWRHTVQLPGGSSSH